MCNQRSLLAWRIATPETPGRSSVALRSADGTELARIPLMLGEEFPPPQVELIERPAQPAKLLPVIHPASGPIQRVVVLYQEHQATAKPPPFVRPFAWVGWDWDMGWIMLYIVVYVPAMLLVKRLLRVP